MDGGRQMDRGQDVGDEKLAIKKLLDIGWFAFSETRDRVASEIGGAVQLLKKTVDGLPLLVSLERHNPLYEPLSCEQDIAELKTQNWRFLTIKSLQHVYQGLLFHIQKCRQARLGDEDIRWLNTLFSGVA